MSKKYLHKLKETPVEGGTQFRPGVWGWLRLMLGAKIVIRRGSDGLLAHVFIEW